jgi:hypothetical protein
VPARNSCRIVARDTGWAAWLLSRQFRLDHVLNRWKVEPLIQGRLDRNEILASGPVSREDHDPMHLVWPLV